MITVWIIGLILSFLGILLFKNSRIKATRQTWDTPAKPERPVLRVWSLLLFILGALLPIFNIFMGVGMIVCWFISVYVDGDWSYKDNSFENRVVQLLNKPIK